MITKLIVGLGNIGKDYEGTRHNIGFAFLDFLEGKLDTKKFMPLKPTTFVNKSGEDVKKAKNKYKIKAENIIIVHDDLDIEFGNVKLSFAKDSGGHRGVQSIIDHLKTNKFWRLRLGTANRKLKVARHQKNLKAKKEAVGDFVLSKFTPNEREKLKQIFKQAFEKLCSNISMR